jgi:bifunctional DNA-binding transcriptional regulator/antitoxin component of YhaV-PrlF toxin-antitoxin module
MTIGTYSGYTRNIDVSPGGVIVLPKVVRDALGLSGKGRVTAEEVENGAVLRRTQGRGADTLRVSRHGVCVLPPTALGGWISSGKIACTVRGEEVVLHRKE